SEYEYDHHATGGVNSVLIGDIEWSGQREQIFQNDTGLPNTYLYNGENTIYIRLPGISGIGEKEGILMDYFEITYWREYKTNKDYLKFSRPDYNYAETHEPFGLYQFELKNFSSDKVSVYKIGSSYMENLQIESFYQSGGAPYTITFQDSIIADNIQYFAVTENNKKKPVQIQPDFPSNIKLTSNNADYIIITPQRFKFEHTWSELEDGFGNGIELYRDTWQQQGINTKIVFLQDIFDEFNHGIRSAEAIKEFISFAYYNWAQRPSHILFMGDGVTDERDYNNFLQEQKEKFNLIPFRNIWVSERGAIASDNWFACVVGDDIVADVSIGRINIWKAEQIYDVADKTIHYLENPNFADLWHSRFAFAAGGNPGEGSFFAEQSERIRNNYLPADYHASRIYCNTNDLPDEYGGNTTSLIGNINDGALFVQFMGHGAGYVWADYNLLNKADIATFNNENYPFFSSLSCYGSAFNYPQSSCIGEELILQPGKGGIGHIGFTGYGYKDSDEYFGNYLMQGIVNENIVSLGEITDYTKAKFFSSNGSGEVGTALIQGCALLGDPMIKLILPQQQNNIELTDYNVNEGDSIDFVTQVSEKTIGGKFRIYNENDVQIPFTQFYPYEIPAVGNEIVLEDFVVPEIEEPIYQRNIKLFTYSENGETISSSKFTVGKSAFVNMEIEPVQPTENDSIQIRADFFDEDGISSVSCLVSGIAEIPMQEIEPNRYELTEKIAPIATGSHIAFYFRIIDTNGEITDTEIQNIKINGPDLLIRNYRRSNQEGYPIFEVLVSNTGDTPAPNSVLKLYNLDSSDLTDSISIEPMEVMEERWEQLDIPLVNGLNSFYIVVNENGESFSETNLNNNSVTTGNIELNLYELTQAGETVSSLDNNLICQLPPNLFSQNTALSLLEVHCYEAINQPDISSIKFSNEAEAAAYNIEVLNEELLADSLGHLPDDKDFEISFNYSATDSLTQLAAQQKKLAIYRWQDDYKKWVIVGGEVDTDTNTISSSVKQIGAFTVFQNNDSKAPTIQANVEGQEFTHGGFIAKDGTISFTLSDANGIDIFSQTVAIYLNSELVPTEDYSQSFSYGNLVHVPLKYQLKNLNKGDHSLAIN
ncbi:MAG: C25 family cysteine peptidase, partial [Candidatus Cloacimonadota bacterium]|nr:C25 family cysteine peptidase [Candidatus Cloacimonadota bacterium]